MTEVLKMFQFLQQDRMAEMQIRAVGSKPALIFNGIPVRADFRVF